MKKLNKRFDKSLKSIKAQKTCPCSYSACGSCGTDANRSSSLINYYYNQHKNAQYKLY